MRYILTILPGILLSLSAYACSHAPDTATASSPTLGASPAVATAAKETLHLNDPAGDFAAAWAKGDRRFIGIMGVGVFLPGIQTSDQPRLIEKFGAKVVDGITDVMDDRTRRLYQPATKYAEDYNRLLLDRINRESP